MRINSDHFPKCPPLLHRGGFLLYNDFIRNKHLMIEKKIIYKIEFTEEQVKDLYDLLEGEYHEGTLEINHDELIVIHNELKKLFG